MKLASYLESASGFLMGKIPIPHLRGVELKLESARIAQKGLHVLPGRIATCAVINRASSIQGRNCAWFVHGP